MTKARLISVLVCTTALVVAGNACAKEPGKEAVVLGGVGKSGMGISAVVGGDAISSYELDNRMRFIITTAHMSNTPDIIERIRPQVMRSLMDERLQVQEAEKNGIIVTAQDVESSIQNIEQQRQMAPGSIKRMLESARIPTNTFTDQVKAQIAWNRLVMRKIKPQIHISDDEVRLAGKKILLPKEQQIKELKIAVLQLPFDKPARAVEMGRLADKLVGEVRAGASFEEVARQFSSGSAASGGKVDTFWIRPEQLAPAIAERLKNAKEGMVTDPVRGSEGYTIVKVYDVRAVEEQEQTDTAVAIKEILLRLKPGASTKEADALLQIGQDVAKHPGSCEEKGVANIDDLKDFDIEVNIYNNLMSELSPAVKVIAENLQVGEISTPFASDEGIRLYMLCDKKDSRGKLDRDRVVALLFQQKMELEAQKYLRNLRRNVYSDVR